MPYQIKNGIIYSGNAVTLTQAEYDALTEAEKNNGTVYYISDSSAVMDASDVGIEGGGNLQNLVGSVATIETSPATAIHAVGDYIVWNGQLYEVTAAIAVGETLTVDTNIEATSVGAELTALNTGLMSSPYDESKLVSIASGYVAQTRGMLQIVASNGTAQYAGGYVRINNVTVFNMGNLTAASNLSFIFPVPVFKGDVVTFAAEGNGTIAVKFMPF